MKYLFFIPLAGAALFAGCNAPAKDEVTAFIPGVYTRFSQHEFGSEYDTLVISSRNTEANEFTIVRKWKYERLLDGERLEPEYKLVVSTGIYDAARKLLQETETAEYFSFDVKKKILFNGTTQYQKL